MSESMETRARELLKLHSGACSVRDDSDHGREYRRLEQLGEVKITASGMVGYIRVTDKDYKTPAEKAAEA